MRMILGTEPYIERAREHLESEDSHRLRYACLELRYALEYIAYHKLEFRLDKVSWKEITAWQPSRAMDILMNLVDEHLDKNYTIQIAEDTKAASEDRFSHFRKIKGISPRQLGKYWHKIGSYLHVQMPKKKGEKPVVPDMATLKPYLEEVIKYIEDITETGSDAYFSSPVTFDCKKCKQKIVRNQKLLKPEDIVQCQNPNCNASYVTEIKNDEFVFQLYRISVDCKGCGESLYFEANVVLKIDPGKLLHFKCNKCNTRYVTGWLLTYDIESDIDKNKLRETS